MSPIHRQNITVQVYLNLRFLIFRITPRLLVFSGAQENYSLSPTYGHTQNGKITYF